MDISFLGHAHCHVSNFYLKYFNFSLMNIEFLVPLCNIKNNLLFIFSLDWLTNDSHVVQDSTAAQVNVAICFYRINLKCQSGCT